MSTAFEGFRHRLGLAVFKAKYAYGDVDTWDKLTQAVVDKVIDSLYTLQQKPYPGFDAVVRKHKKVLDDLKRQLITFISKKKFIPGGRYLYYATKQHNFFNNCYLLRVEEDSRRGFSTTLTKAADALMTGGGIGIDYSVVRPAGAKIVKTGGISAGPVSLMKMINEVGKNVQQGGSRRSAIYGSLHWQHPDALSLVYVKDWNNDVIPGFDYTYGQAKEKNFDFPAPLDSTNISLNYDDAWLNLPDRARHPVFLENCRMALTNGEPGFSFNFGSKQNETLRNACCEITSEDDSDVCNLGSVNLAEMDSIEEFEAVVFAAAAFLYIGTVTSIAFSEKSEAVKNKNRRIGLGLMGIHEWLLVRGYDYAENPELSRWLEIYKTQSKAGADYMADLFNLNRSIAYRAIAPNGTIGRLAGTTTGIEPIFAPAYLQRYIADNERKEVYVIDPTAIAVYNKTGNALEAVASAFTLEKDMEKRIRFQAYIQQYVDQAISSTINIAAPKLVDIGGKRHASDEDTYAFAALLSKYAPYLRGITVYPNGARGGQPLTPVSLKEAMRKNNIVDVYDSCKEAVCGV